MGGDSSKGVGRRQFLTGATAAVALGSASVVPGRAQETGSPAAREGKKTGRRRLPLWCDRGGLINPTQASDEAQVREFVQKCVDHGVTTLLPWNGTEILSRVAHEHGLEVQPYLAFNNHGENEVRYAWSVNFIGPAPGTPEGEEILDHHRPIWSHRREELDLTDFARENPSFWCRDRRGDDSLRPGQRLSLSLVHPEVRAWEIDAYLDLFRKSGGDGIQVEFISVDQDDRQAAIYGYEGPMVAAFEREHGRSPVDLANDEPEWLRFRASYVTKTLRELHRRVKKERPQAVVSIAVIARPADEYMKVLLDWPAWVKEGLVDEFYLWFRTASDGAALEERVEHAAMEIGGRCPLVVELSCYHPGSYQDPKVMTDMARRAKASGADAVGIYRSHAVDQLGFWPVLEAIGNL
jgi:hypothetical protein